MAKDASLFSKNQAIPKTISQSIYLYIKEAIVKNKLKANQPINEKEIAKLFSISTTPVREAVLRLGVEGYVKLDSHRDALVMEVSYEELKEIFDVLGMLDGFAAGLAAEQLTPEDLEEIEETTARMARHCGVKSIDKYLSLNAEIHLKIWSAVPNRMLRKTLLNLYDQLLRYNYARIQAFRRPGILEKSMNSHNELLNALKRKDAAEIEELATNHWNLLFNPSGFEAEFKELLFP